MANANTFTNAAGGTWSVGANWSLGTMPDTGADVTFVSGTYTSTADGGPWTIDGLDVNVPTVILDIRRRPKSVESREMTRPDNSAREIPARSGPS
jgi:hypothetical protein